MSSIYSIPGILVSNFPVIKPLIKILVLTLISIGMHNDELFAQSREQFLEKRKLYANQNKRSYPGPVKSISHQFNLDRNQCEFTLNSVHAVNNPLAQII